MPIHHGLRASQSYCTHKMIFIYLFVIKSPLAFHTTDTIWSFCTDPCNCNWSKSKANSSMNATHTKSRCAFGVRQIEMQQNSNVFRTHRITLAFISAIRVIQTGNFIVFHPHFLPLRSANQVFLRTFESPNSLSFDNAVFRACTGETCSSLNRYWYQPECKWEEERKCNDKKQCRFSVEREDEHAVRMKYWSVVFDRPQKRFSAIAAHTYILSRSFNAIILVHNAIFHFRAFASIVVSLVERTRIPSVHSPSNSSRIFHVNSFHHFFISNICAFSHNRGLFLVYFFLLFPCICFLQLGSGSCP